MIRIVHTGDVHLGATFPLLGEFGRTVRRNAPILLDDPLVHCNPARRGAPLRLFADCATTGQVLQFTCHEFPE